MQMTAEVVAAECDFSQQLQNLMGSLAAESEGEPKSEVAEERQGKTAEREKAEREKAERGKKEEPLPAPVTMTIFASILPARLPGGFGLPTAGDEAGSTLATVEVAPADTFEMAASIEINAPAPAAKDSAIDPRAELAFAVRLTDLTNTPAPQRVADVMTRTPAPLSIIEPNEPVAVISSETQRPEAPITPAVMGVMQQTASAAGASEPSAATEPVRITNETPRPEARTTPVLTGTTQLPAAATPNEPVAAIEPIRITNQTQQPGASATPAIRELPQQETSNADSSFSDSDHPPAESSPRPQQQRTERSNQASEVAAIDTAAPTGNAAQTLSPAPIAIASPTIAAHSSAAPSTRDAAPANPVHHTDRTWAIPPSATSAVTEISVTVPVSRTDSAGEEHVAIHMAQRGTEIHVSVRTPDAEVAQSLRQDLRQLASSLDDAGFQTETWRPAALTVAAASSTNTQRDTAQEAPNRNAAGEDERSNGNSGREAGEQRRRQQDERPRWVAELDEQTNR